MGNPENIRLSDLTAKQVRIDTNLSNKTEFNRSEEHTSELQSHHDLVCRLLLEKKKNTTTPLA